MRAGVSNVSSGAGGDRRGPPQPQTPSRTSNLQVFSDTRTNSLLVTGSPDQQKLVEEIVKTLDVDEDAKGNKLSRSDRSGPFLKVYKVAGRADQVASKHRCDDARRARERRRECRNSTHLRHNQAARTGG